MDTPNFLNITLGLCGGLGLFLLGMNLMTDALNALAGGRMKTLLGRFTGNRFSAALSGASVTAAIQSSSVTTVLLVGFTSAGLLSLQQSAGVIFGANLGSTVTAQIIAFKIGQAGGPLIVLGLFLSLFKPLAKLRRIGLLIIGFGAIFYGMEEMSAATRPLRDYQPFLKAIATLGSIGWAALAGFVVTTVIQSSAATIGMAIILAGQGFFTLESAIAVALGANIGTCATAALAAIGRNRTAWQVAFVHIAFNVIGVALWLPLIDQLAAAATWTSQRLGDSSLPRQIAWAHTLFNIANLALFIGFTRQFAWIAQRLIPLSRNVPAKSAARYLDKLYLDTPEMAVDRARLEAAHLAELAVDMARRIPPAALSGSAEALDQLALLDDQLDDLQTDILTYLSQINAARLSPEGQAGARKVIAIVNAWENIGDTLDKHILALGRDRIESGADISEQTRRRIAALLDSLFAALDAAHQITLKPDPALAAMIIENEGRFTELADLAEADLADRLPGRDAAKLELFRLESDIIGNLKRIHDYAKRIAELA